MDVGNFEEAASVSLGSTLTVGLDSNVDWTKTMRLDDDDELGEPVKPQVPSYLDSVRWADMPAQIAQCLALALDVDAIGDVVRNWEYLAASLGASVAEIDYMKSKIQYPASYVNHLVRKYPDKSLGDVLRIIRDDLLRYDLILELSPVFPKIENKLNSNSKNVKSAESSQNEGNTDFSISADQSGNLESCSTSYSVLEMVKRVKDDLILITFYSDDKSHTRNVNHLKKNLLAFFDNVVSDVDIMDKHYYDLKLGFSRVFEMATYVIVVCSPGYLSCVEPNISSLNDGTTHVDQLSQFRRYLFNLMFDEFHRLGCRNKRFRPVVLTSSRSNAAKTVECVPAFLRNTLIFYWPIDHQSFMRFLCEKK